MEPDQLAIYESTVRQYQQALADMTHKLVVANARNEVKDALIAELKGAE